MELKNIVLFILLVLTVIAMSFSNLTGSDTKPQIDSESNFDTAGESDSATRLSGAAG